MKLVLSVTVETPHGDKMVPHMVDVGDATNSHLRHVAASALAAVLTKATDYGAHRLRAASIVLQP